MRLLLYSEVFVIVSLTLFLPICLEQFARYVSSMPPTLSRSDPAHIWTEIMVTFFLTRYTLVPPLLLNLLRIKGTKMRGV